MNIINPHLICLIEENTDVRDKIITALSAEGYLTSGFRTFPEAMNYLHKSPSPLSLLLANNACSYHEWFVFRSELNEIERMKEAKFHTYHIPLNLSALLQEVSEIFNKMLK